MTQEELMKAHGLVCELARCQDPFELIDRGTDIEGELEAWQGFVKLAKAIVGDLSEPIYGEDDD